jgi:TolB-like protein
VIAGPCGINEADAPREQWKGAEDRHLAWPLLLTPQGYPKLRKQQWGLVMAGNGAGESSDADTRPPEASAPIALARVFISYASQDADTANQICRSLESQGIGCWIAPRDVKPGAEYADAIVRAINDAKALVLVMSAGAVASAHVGREVERAASKRKPVIAFRIDAAPLSAAMEYFLSQSQWIDVPVIGMKAALLQVVEAVVSDSLSAVIRTRHPVAQKSNSRRVVIAAAILIGLGAAVAGLRFWPSRNDPHQPAVNPIADKSIAVLPFVDMSEKKDQEYFADGMAEEIIDLLVKVPGLKVISRTSSFQFKGKTEDLRNIGKQLGVAYVLEGSVRKSGERLRITAQLIDSRDGTHLMSQVYDRDLSDVLKMQDEIAASLVRVLQVEVSEHILVSRSALRNTQAYTLYLQGLHAKDRFDQQGFEQAVNDFQQALDLDPSFTAAAGGLANAYFLLGQFGFMPPGGAFQRAREAAKLALKLDPKLAATHALLGNVYIAYDWDWAAASQEIQLALDEAPNDAYVLSPRFRRRSWVARTRP